MAKLVRKSKKESAEPDFFPATRRALELAADKKAIDPRAYDLRGLTVIADSFVICSASSDPHMKAIHASIVAGMKEDGWAARRTEGGSKDKWMVVDFGSIIVHIFREDSRAFYDLDALWGDAPEIKLDAEA